MEINQAKPTDLIEILYLLKVCTRDMNANGQIFWNSCFPPTESVQSDLANGFIYLTKDKGVCKGMITLNVNEPEEYKDLNLSTSAKKTLYLQNIAVHPRWQGTGIATQMINFAQKFAREQGYDSIRLDIFKQSEQARQLCEKQLFKEVASFHADYQKVPFICYEKQL